jgi:hypothetical protein
LKCAARPERTALRSQCCLSCLLTLFDAKTMVIAFTVWRSGEEFRPPLCEANIGPPTGLTGSGLRTQEGRRALSGRDKCPSVESSWRTHHPSHYRRAWAAAHFDKSDHRPRSGLPRSVRDRDREPLLFPERFGRGSVGFSVCGIVNVPEFPRQLAKLSSDHVPTELLLSHDDVASFGRFIPDDLGVPAHTRD